MGGIGIEMTEIIDFLQQKVYLPAYDSSGEVKIAEGYGMAVVVRAKTIEEAIRSATKKMRREVRDIKFPKEEPILYACMEIEKDTYECWGWI